VGYSVEAFTSHHHWSDAESIDRLVFPTLIDSRVYFSIISRSVKTDYYRLTRHWRSSAIADHANHL